MIDRHFDRIWKMKMEQLSFEEIDAVSGGASGSGGGSGSGNGSGSGSGSGSGIGGALVGWLVGKAADAVVGWVKEKAPGGADETTWTNVGNSQMGA